MSINKLNGNYNIDVTYKTKRRKKTRFNANINVT